MALPTPSLTLYVSNLETKTKKPELKAQLYALFNPYGRVIDIVAQKHNGGRGQAFVVFEDQKAATSALRGLTGEMFYERDLRISYARQPSHATLSLQDPESSREAAAIRAAKMTVSNAQGEYEQLERERVEEDMRLAGQAMGKRELEDGAEEGPAGKKAKIGGSGGEEEDEDMEMEMDDEDDADEAAPASGSTGKTLICSNLPAECNDEIMGALFSQYPGFSSAASLPSSRVPASHPAQNEGAKAFTITFESAAQATAAMGETKGYTMQPGWDMGVTAQ